MKLGEAARLAEELKCMLSSSCERAEIVGSIRRQQPDPGDIELLCIPRKTVWDGDALDVKVKSLIASGVLDYRKNIIGSKVYGPKNKLLVHKATGMAVDIFSTDEECWPVAMVIRTGSKENNIKIAKAAHKKGLHLLAYGPGFRKNNGEVIVCKSEKEVFEKVGLDYKEPWER